MEVETVVGTDKQQGVEQGPDGKLIPLSDKTDGVALDIEKELEGETEGKKPEGEAAGEKKPEGEGEAEKPAATDAPADLGEYKADDPEVVSKFDTQYFTEEGKLNEKVLSAEFWSNENALRDGTYAYLEDRLGVSKELVKELEAGLVAKHSLGEAEGAAAVHTLAGSEERYSAALAWASAGETPAYSKEQQARFNKVVRGRLEGWEDAVTALVARYDAANPSRKLPNLPERRRSAPARDVTSEQGGAKPGEAAAPSIKPFKDNDEYMVALKEARNDPRKMAEVRARSAASSF